LASSKIFFETFLFPLNGESHLSVECCVAVGADAEMIAVLVGRVNFPLTRVKGGSSLWVFELWHRRCNTEASQ